jgi:hypothetical protein
MIYIIYSEAIIELNQCIFTKMAFTKPLFMKYDKVYPFFLTLVSLTIFFFISSCTHTPVIDNIPEVCFEKDVLPIFQNNCAISGCHSGTGESHFKLDSYSSISESVVAGKPYSSRAYNAIISAFGDNLMPPGQPLSLNNRTIIRLWIEQGAGNTTCPDTTGQGGSYVNPLACYSRDIQPVLTSKCAIALCHDVTTHAEGYIYSSYASTRATVSPGSPSGSKLYQVINGSGENKMPPSGKVQLTSAEIDSIGSWISNGALNQFCGETCDTISPITFSGTIWPIMQSSCAGCHGGTAPSGGITITGYSNVSALAASGALINALKGIGVPRAMPPGSAFTSCRIREFEIWVNNGHLNN